MVHDRLLCSQVIIGISVGCVGMVIALGCLVYGLLRNKLKKEQETIVIVMDPSSTASWRSSNTLSPRKASSHREQPSAPSANLLLALFNSSPQELRRFNEVELPTATIDQGCELLNIPETEVVLDYNSFAEGSSGRIYQGKYQVLILCKFTGLQTHYLSRGC